MKHAMRFLACVIVASAGVARASADTTSATWLECSVTRTAQEPDGTSRELFSMKMIFAYDSDGNVWTYFPVSQHLIPISGAHIDGGKISWLPSQLAGQAPQSGEEPTTIDLGSGEYHGTSVVHASDGSTTTQLDSGQCQTTASRSVVSD